MHRHSLILSIIAIVFLSAMSGCISPSKRSSDPYYSAYAPAQQSMRGSEQSETAAKTVDPKATKHTHKSNALLLAGIEAESEGDLTGAEKSYLKCVEHNANYKIPKNSATAYHRLAVVTAKMKDYGRSEKYFREALKDKPQDTELMCDFAQLLNEQERYYEAELVLKNAILINPEDPKTLYFLGNVLGSQRHYQLGLRYLRKSIGEIEALKEIAVIYRKNGEHAIADATERKIARLIGEDDHFQNIAKVGSRPPASFDAGRLSPSVNPAPSSRNSNQQYRISMPQLPNPDSFIAESNKNNPEQIERSGIVSAGAKEEEKPSYDITPASYSERAESPVIIPAGLSLAMDQRTKRISLTPFAWEQNEPDTFLLNARTQSENNSSKRWGGFLNLPKPSFALRSDSNDSRNENSNTQTHNHNQSGSEKSNTAANSQQQQVITKPVPVKMTQRRPGIANDSAQQTPAPAISSSLNRVATPANTVSTAELAAPRVAENQVRVAAPVIAPVQNRVAAPIVAPNQRLNPNHVANPAPVVASNQINEPIMVSNPQQVQKYAANPVVATSQKTGTPTAELAQVSAVSESQQDMAKFKVDPKLSISEGYEHDFSLRWPREQKETQIPSKVPSNEVFAVRRPESIPAVATIPLDVVHNEVTIREERKNSAPALKMELPEFETISLNESLNEIPVMEIEPLAVVVENTVVAPRESFEAVEIAETELAALPLFETISEHDLAIELGVSSIHIPEFTAETSYTNSEDDGFKTIETFKPVENFRTNEIVPESVPVLSLPANEEVVYTNLEEQQTSYIEPEAEFKFSETASETAAEMKYKEELLAAARQREEMRRAEARLLELRQEEIRLAEQRITELRADDNDSGFFRISNLSNGSQKGNVGLFNKTAELANDERTESSISGSSSNSETSELSFVISEDGVEAVTNRPSDSEAREENGAVIEETKVYTYNEPELFAEQLPEPAVLEKRIPEVLNLTLNPANSLRNGNSLAPKAASNGDSFEDYYYAELSNKNNGYFGATESRVNTATETPSAAATPRIAVPVAVSRDSAASKVVLGAHSEAPGRSGTQVRHPENTPGYMNTKSIR